MSFEEELRNPIPLYDFYAAAGTFSELQSEKSFTLIEGPESGLGQKTDLKQPTPEVIRHLRFYLSGFS